MLKSSRHAPVKARNRPVVGTGRLLICQLAGDDAGNTTAALRLQRLASAAGIVGPRAALIATLARGETA